MIYENTSVSTHTSMCANSFNLSLDALVGLVNKLLDVRIDDEFIGFWPAETLWSP